MPIGVYKRPTPKARFTNSYKVIGNCWVWTNAKENTYGRMRINGALTRPHRFSYELHVGKIPKGLVIDHLCRNKRCVNPEHLEAVSFVENIMRGDSPAAVNARKTHCCRGHRLNKIYYKTKKGSGRRRKCLKCRPIYALKYYLKRKSPSHARG